MSLATRCSACSTVFRVQKDQLKASEGWVRCGRCGTVFSALEGLFDLEREAHSGPMPLHGAPVPAPPPPPQHPQHPPPHVAAAHVPDIVVPLAADDAAATATAAQDDDANAPTQALLRNDGDSLVDHGMVTDASADRAAATASFGVSRPHPAIDDYEEDEAALSILEHSGSHTLEESRPVPDSRPASLSAPSSVLPSFAREPAAARRWRKQRPVARRLTIAAAIALPLLLGLQMALQQRDLVAARWPAAAEPLRAVCAWLGCVVQAPRALDALSVESSGLTRVDGTPLYRLQVTLRNRASWAVAMPSLDLTLTDSRGEIVSRRALPAADLGPNAPAELGAGAEWSALATLDVGERRVTGYTIDLFYP